MIADEIPYPVFAAIDAQPSKVLTREQEHILAVRASAGDHRARGELVERNLRLVIKIAAGYTARAPQLELHDLVSEGVLGLMRAIDKFDPHSGFKLSTYATWWIKQAVCRAADKAGTVSIPMDLRRELRATELHLEDSLGRHPTDDEVMDALSDAMQMRIDEHDLAAARSAMHCASLDHQNHTDDGNGGTLGTLIADPTGVDPADVVCDAMEVRAEIEAATSQLAPDEQQLVERRFGLDGSVPATLATVANEMNIEPDDARRLERQAFSNMRLTAGVSADPPAPPCKPAAAVLDLLRNGRRGQSPTRVGREALAVT